MTLKTTKLRDAIGLALVAGATTFGAAGVAFAQEAEAPSESTTTLDRIEVTGSRIRQASVETATVVVSEPRNIENMGVTSVADILQNLTSAGSPAISRGDVLASGENVGGYYIDLRNLGASRTLVLVNGKRLGANTTGLQDLGQIPASAIERVEVLKDGASSIYGSDAIAGVVNVITRRRFEGAELKPTTASSRRQRQQQDRRFHHRHRGERGGVTMSVEYGKKYPIGRATCGTGLGQPWTGLPGRGLQPRQPERFVLRSLQPCRCSPLVDPYPGPGSDRP